MKVRNPKICTAIKPTAMINTTRAITEILTTFRTVLTPPLYFVKGEFSSLKLKVKSISQLSNETRSD
jgi:hypothetical protein